jgi:thioredoxin
MNNNTVTVYLYDISNGMARTFGHMFVGKPVEGVWHTSIVVFGKEYYFQGGIAIDRPKMTPFGLPVKTIEMGNTELAEEDLNAYLVDIKPQFTPESYNIFDHNCNHFSNTLCEFLTGNHIPKDIMEQAKEYKDTPIGQFIKNLENQHKNVNGVGQNFNMPPNNAQGFNLPQQFGFQNQGGMPAMNMGGSQAQPAPHSKNVTDITDIIAYTEIITGNDRVIVDFYANWCGPCKVIKPEYDKLADANVGSIKFCSVNVDSAQEISMTLGVKSMPTFLILFKGEEISRVSGADPMKLRLAVEQLKNKQ